MMQQTPSAAGTSSALTFACTLNDLVDALRDIDFDTVDTARVRAIVGAARLDEASIAPFVYFEPGRYARNGVYRDDRFELILMCWSDGARSTVHGHGGSHGFVKVCRGALRVDNYTILEGGREPGPARLAPAASVTMHAGDVEVVAPGQDVHQVAPHEGPAISLHLYAKPLTAYLVYDAAGQSCRTVLAHYDIPPHR